MRSVHLLSLSALVCVALAAGCYEDEPVPAQTRVVATTPPPPPPVAATVIVHSRPAAPPPAQPTVVTTLEPQPPTGPAQNVPPPPVGVTEMQPPPPATEPDPGTRVRQITLLATQQIERLSRRETRATGSAKSDIDTVIADLKVRREKVQQDYRELQAQQSAGSDTLTMGLDREINGLRDAINDSYQLESPAGHALAPPAPLPPSQLP